MSENQVYSDLAAVLDLGSSKLNFLVGTASHPGAPVEILARHTQPLLGMREGQVFNLEEVQNGIEEGLRRLQEDWGGRIHEVVVSLSGTKLLFRREGYRLRVCRDGMRRGGCVIREDNLRHLHNLIIDQFYEQEYQPVHFLEQFYDLDSGNGIPNPVGLHSVTLKTHLAALFFREVAVRNQVQTVVRAGLSVAQVAAAGLSAALAVMDEDERHLGVVVVDFGAHLTKVVLYRHGRIHYAWNYDLGSQRITRDLTKPLHVDQETAEILKCRHARVGSQSTGQADRLDFRDISHHPRSMVRSELTQLVKPRVEEIFANLFKELKRKVALEYFGGGIILTGGGSRLEGICEVVEQITGMNTRLGEPRGFLNYPQDFVWEDASALGMLRLALDPRADTVMTRSQRLQNTPWRRLNRKIISKIDRIFRH